MLTKRLLSGCCNIHKLIEGFVDANCAGVDNRKFIFEYVFMLFRSTVCWRVILQLVAVLSTTQ